MSKPKTLIFTLLITAVAAMGATSNLQEAAKPKRNLKVLPKNISHDDLDKVMDDWKAALGVKCNFCHTPLADNPRKMDWASDAKPEKAMAREMFTMTGKINKKFFHAKKGQDGMIAMEAVNCNTCHHGEAHPEIKEDKMTK